MFFVFVISPTMEARGVPTNAKPEEKASELANAGLDAQKRTIVYTPIAGSSYRRSIDPYTTRWCPPDFPYRRCRSKPPPQYGQPPPQHGPPPQQYGQPPLQYGQPPPPLLHTDDAALHILEI
ncbi:hypothetical protein QJS10_CPA07g00357 [Acorus calamus]|uniref:Uncharacterized protein n=1 Tax=Acorus calamus TaxID=4465 RepID=A0AAV9EI97_ACOCL|nr:hypothetical protein QJS10_CPA07g00357 [Acorus calamus]